MDFPEVGPNWRADVARLAVAEYDDWTHGRGRYADGTAALNGTAMGALASAARWLLEDLGAAAEARAGAAAATGRANTAVAGLDTRAMRDVLNVLAAQQPAAVLAAVAEAGYGRG